MLRAVSGLTRQQAVSFQVQRRNGGAGRWMVFSHTGAAPAAVDTLYLYWMPWFEDYAVTLLRTRCTAGGAGSAIKFALWRDDPAVGRPTGLPVIGQNTGLSTVTTNTFQDLVVASQRMGSPSGVWFGSVLTGTLPSMVVAQSTGNSAFATVWPAGAAPTTPRGNFSIAQPYANDIMALNLTGASLTEVTGGVPAFFMEWA